MLFPPFLLIFLVLFFLGLLLLFGLVQMGLISYAFAKVGLPARHLFSLLFLSLLGSYVNIPLKRVKSEHIIQERVISYFGLRFRVPVWGRRETVIAVNLGGAIIPTCLSGYLLLKMGHLMAAVLATLLVAIISYGLSRPVPGIGITVPTLAPALTAALGALILAPEAAPPVAYVAGTMGTLIGADLCNLDRIAGLGAPVASIGGAGTFDGIFLCGIVAVLLA